MAQAARSAPAVIAHRGASGYLPEHTLAAKAMAHAMGADFLEQDVIATRDGELVVLHDLTLDHVTDVAQCYPGRQRADGHFYCIDFTLAELRNLSIVERRAATREGGVGQGARFPQRFPLRAGLFGIVTFEEELEFIRGLNASSGRSAGIYPEIKDPAWHREQGIDISPQFLATLTRAGYRAPEDPAFVQCFDPVELRRVRESLGCPLQLVQLIEGLNSGGSVPSRPELRTIAQYANGIGPSISLIANRREGRREPTTLVEDAHAERLLVHPYTFRRDDLPPGFGSFDELLDLFLNRLGVDGIFTDFPDLAVRYRETQGAAAGGSSRSGQR
jgi:glycerophosphoryl diester phosphodiesterase